jgi:hypothetical protein
MTTKIRDLNSVRSDLKHYSRMLAVAEWDLEETQDEYLIKVLKEKRRWYREEIANLEVEYAKLAGIKI